MMMSYKILPISTSALWARSYKFYCNVYKVEHVGTAGRWLKAERVRLGWSTTDAARFASAESKAAGFPLEVKQQSISQLENGKLKSVPRWFRFVKTAIERRSGLTTILHSDNLNHLPSDEIELLSKYRELPVHDRVALLRIARTIYEAASAELALDQESAAGR